MGVKPKSFSGWLHAGCNARKVILKSKSLSTAKKLFKGKKVSDSSKAHLLGDDTFSKKIFAKDTIF